MILVLFDHEIIIKYTVLDVVLFFKDIYSASSYLQLILKIILEARFIFTWSLDFSVAVINTTTKDNLGREGFVSPHRSLPIVKQSQGRNLEANTEAEL